jgi:hypothetical protein
MSDDDCPFDGGTIPTTPLSQHQPHRPTPAATTESVLDQIKHTPITSLGFGQFAKLKSGRDNYSAMKLPELRKSISEAELQFVSDTFTHDDKLQAACIRWMLRGLDRDKAARKIQVDLEISAKGTGKRAR